jgi:hypothetical protein
MTGASLSRDWYMFDEFRLGSGKPSRFDILENTKMTKRTAARSKRIVVKLIEGTLIARLAIVCVYN